MQEARGSWNITYINSMTKQRGQRTIRQMDDEADANFWTRIGLDHDQAISHGFVCVEFQNDPAARAMAGATQASAEIPFNEPPMPDDPVAGTAVGEGSTANQLSEMAIAKFQIVADRNGLPQLELYQEGHKWADLRYSLGKDEATRKKNIANLMGSLGWKPELIKVMKEPKDVKWIATWGEGKNPKYKDVVIVRKAA